MRWVNVGWGAGMRWVREWGECVGGQVGLASWLVVVRAGFATVGVSWNGMSGCRVFTKMDAHILVLSRKQKLRSFAKHAFFPQRNFLHFRKLFVRKTKNNLHPNQN
jgi:hypothetical protein